MGGTLVVLLAFCGALIYLYRLARGMLGDDARAADAVWLLAVYPFAVFYSAVYTESLFLLGALGAFYHFQRGEYARAGAWGVLVGLTRPNGCFLAVPLGILAVAPWLPRWLAGRGSDEPAGPRPRSRRRRCRPSACCCIRRSSGS
jgi:Gpi18-like mannosyltransferase